MVTQPWTSTWSPAAVRTTDTHMNLRLPHGLVQGTVDTNRPPGAARNIAVFQESPVQKMNRSSCCSSCHCSEPGGHAARGLQCLGAVSAQAPGCYTVPCQPYSARTCSPIHQSRLSQLSPPTHCPVSSSTSFLCALSIPFLHLPYPHITMLETAVCHIVHKYYLPKQFCMQLLIVMRSCF